MARVGDTPGMQAWMARAFVLGSGLALGAGCGDDAPAIRDAGTDARGAVLHGELAWRLRCDVAGGGCTYPDRVVDAFARDPDVDVTCSVVETATTRRITFGAGRGSEFVFSLMNVEVPRAGGAPAGVSGEVAVLEPSALYAGACSADPPSDAHPCQVVAGFTSDAEGSLVVAEVSCVGLVPYMGTSPPRELSGPGDGPTAAASPVMARFHNCRGYVPD